MPVVVKWGKDTPITTVEWLWKPFIPFGKVSLIQGDGGEGKTTLMLKIAAMLSKGELPPTNYQGKLSDGGRMEPITTFYASTEEEISDASRPRFERNGGDINRFAYSAESIEHMNLNYEDLKTAIEQTGARLVIIDPLQAFLPRGVTLNNVSKMRPIFTQLSNVAMETNAAIVLVGHMNKNEAAKDIHRGLGTVDISASVRSIILVSIDKYDPTLRTIRTVKSNFDESDFTPIGFRLDEQRRVYFCDQNDEPWGYEHYDCSQQEDELMSHIPETAPENTPSKFTDACNILMECLSSGSVEYTAVMAVLNENTVSKRTAERAKKELGICSTRRDGKTYWALPEE